MTTEDFQNLMAPMVRMDVKAAKEMFDGDQDSVLASVVTKAISSILITIEKELSAKDLIIDKLTDIIEDLEGRVEAIERKSPDIGSVRLC